MERLLLGIDIGTSSCKVAVFNEDGRVVAQASADYPLYYPEPGWVEQDPEEWWACVCQAVRQCLKDGDVDPELIAGIGLAGQGWSAIPVDVEGNVLQRTPIWLDTRAADLSRRVLEEIPEDSHFSSVRQLVLPHVFDAESALVQGEHAGSLRSDTQVPAKQRLYRVQAHREHDIRPEPELRVAFLQSGHVRI